jgi:glycolate oxidase FAD binding subunit
MEQSQELAPGVTVRRVERVDASSQVADLLAGATRSGATIVPFGGRHSLATGNACQTAAIGLDLIGLAGMIAYEPADLTLSVKAGTLVSDIQGHLGEHGQELPIDVPHPETTTIGGLVATGFAGPRRLRAGSLRDLLIGCEYVRGDGLLAKAGGIVVKNVSGFEIPRFLHGSWGSLAVLTSVNLKIVPRARADATLVAAFDDAGAALDAAALLIAREATIDACVVTRRQGATAVAVRATGRASAVAATLAACRVHLGTPAEAIEASASIAFWQDHVNHFSEQGDSLTIAIAAKVQDMRSLVLEMDALVKAGALGEFSVSPGTDSLRVRFDVAVVAPAMLVQVAEQVTRFGGTWVVESAPAGFRGAISAWGPRPEGEAVMRSVKDAFDPAAVLNPGRLFV